MKPHPYLILVGGELRAVDREWLADLHIGALNDTLTALSGTLDQAALQGVIRRLQHLALDILAVHRLCACRGSHHAASAALSVS